MVEEDSVRGACHRALVGVVEDDVGALAAEFEGELLEVPGGCLEDELADLGGAGEGDLVDIVMGRERGACGLAETWHHVDDAVRNARLGHQLGETQCRQRGLLGRLQHDAVAGGQGGAKLPGSHQQREVPRDDLPYHADRFTQGVGVEVRARHIGHRNVDGVALDLGGPAGHVVKQVGGQRNVGSLRDDEGLAVIHRLQLGELLDVLQDEVANPPDDAPSLRRRHPAPRPVIECLTCSPDGAVDILGVAFSDPGESFAGRWVGCLECLP